MRILTVCLAVIFTAGVALAYPPTETRTSTQIYKESNKRPYQLYDSDKEKKGSVYDSSSERRDSFTRYQKSKWGEEKVPGYGENAKNSDTFVQYKREEERPRGGASRNVLEDEKEEE